MATTFSADLEKADNRRSGRWRSIALDIGFNIAALGALYALYAMVRSGAGATTREALVNARRVLHAEQWLSVAVEDEIQQLFGADWLLGAANHYYLLHFPVTVIALSWTFIRFRSTVFVRFRGSLIGATLAGLVVQYMFPLAPPRMLGGFIDAASRIGPNPYDLPGADSANQLAAMPSMHVGWAVIVGVALYGAHSNRWVRRLAIAHPLITVAVVVVTAHHFVADVAAGAAFALAAWYLARYFQINRCVAFLDGDDFDRSRTGSVGFRASSSCPAVGGNRTGIMTATTRGSGNR